MKVKTEHQTINMSDQAVSLLAALNELQGLGLIQDGWGTDPVTLLDIPSTITRSGQQVIDRLNSKETKS